MTDLETLMQILEKLKQVEELTKRIEKLEKEVETLKKAQEVDLNKLITNMSSNVNLKDRLSIAADLAIKHFEVEPPKRRVPG